MITFPGIVRILTPPKRGWMLRLSVSLEGCLSVKSISDWAVGEHCWSITLGSLGFARERNRANVHSRVLHVRHRCLSGMLGSRVHRLAKTPGIRTTAEGFRRGSEIASAVTRKGASHTQAGGSASEIENQARRIEE